MTKVHLVKRIRIWLSVAVLLLISLLFLNVGGWYRHLFGFLAKIQFMTSAFSFLLGVFIFWLGVTLVIGRIYCSSVCPLGTLQDIFAWIRTRNTRRAYHYGVAHNKMRYGILFIFVLCALLGITIVPYLIEPYSVYGRIVNSTLLPIRNILVDRSLDNIMAYTLVGTTVGLISLVLVAAVSYKHGRLICNTVCPVGSTLSLISRHSVLKMEIDTDKCVGCGMCAFNCKSKCIDLNDHTIDNSRCVMCFNCIDSCHSDALHLTASRKRLSTPMMQEIPKLEGAASVSMDRRKFLTFTGVAALAGKMASADDVINELQGSKPIPRKYAVMPPGTQSRETFHSHCTACMLCVSNCPTRVLKASVNQYGVFNVMQPYMDFDRAACKEGCTRCSRLCPTGALHPLTKQGKLTSPIGLAKVIPENCIGCGVCASVCPYQVIEMVETADTYLPHVDASKCIGCGTCQLNCPATPVKAIWVDGLP